MKIEKLTKSTMGLFEHNLTNMFDKINELIDAFNSTKILKSIPLEIREKKETIILNCPFCGKQPKIAISENCIDIYCINYFCVLKRGYETEQEAIKEWNKRA